MQQQEFEVSTAEGVSIFQPILMGDITLAKGHTLTKEDIINLKLWGIDKVFGAIIETSDVKYDVALTTVVAKLCGSNTAYSITEDSVCKVVADKDGIFVCSDDRVAKFNRKEMGIVLNVIEPYSLVKKGDLIAKVQIIPAFMHEDDLNKIIFAIAGNVPILGVGDLVAKKSALIYAKFYDHKAERSHFTKTVRKLVKDFPHLDFSSEYETRHTVEDIANTVDMASRAGNEIIFVLPGQRSASRVDIAFKALETLGDSIVNCCVPQIDMTDLIIATKKETKIINIPYFYADNNSSLVDKYIKQALANDNIYNFDFKHPQNVILTNEKPLSEEEEKSLVSAQVDKLGEDEAPVAAVVLAGGIGSRAGRNKLMAEQADGRPLFMNAVTAALKSKANPVFVITGHDHEQLEEYMADIDISIIYNSNYRAGVKTSIDVGIKSVPSFCEGALLLPADMPNITSTFINKMISSFKKGGGRQVVIASHKGLKHNPIIWSKELFNFADLVPENSNLRPVLVEFNDLTTLVDAKKEAELLDVNYPNDVQEAIK